MAFNSYLDTRLVNFIQSFGLSRSSVKDISVKAMSDEILLLTYSIGNSNTSMPIGFNGFISKMSFKDREIILVPYIKIDGKLFLANGFEKSHPKETDIEKNVTINDINQLHSDLEVGDKKMDIWGVELSGSIEKSSGKYCLVLKKEMSVDLKETLKLIFKEIDIKMLKKIDKKLLELLEWLIRSSTI